MGKGPTTKYDPNELKLLNLIENLHRRNRALGLERYDEGDVLSHPLYFHCLNSAPGSIRKISRIPEMLAPILWRKVLSIEKRLVPVTLYHLAMACYYLKKSGLAGRVMADASSEEFAEQALELRLDADLSAWGHPYRHHGQQWTRAAPIGPKGCPEASCAHHNARLGILFARLGDEGDVERYCSVATQVAQAMISYHNWSFRPDGSWAVSYYPTSRDEVINTAAEVAVLFAALPVGARTKVMQERLEGLARMIVTAQREDGSWYYCTARHYDRHGGKRVIDNHHTAMILAALAELQREPTIPPYLGQRLGASLRAGIDYYLDYLVEPNGWARAFPDARREAPLAGYGEGVLALGKLVELAADVVGEVRRSEARERLDSMLVRMIEGFVDTRTGDVASARFLGRPVHLRSIRLGSGLLLECLARRLWWSRRGVLPTWGSQP